MAIFVSYCSVDQKSVKPLLGQIAKLKREVYVETKSVSGEVAWSLIFDTIQTCEVFILALTSHTLLSDARRLEYQYASALNKPILVVALEAIPDNVSEDGKLAYIDVSKALDFREFDENSETVLSNALANLPSTDAAPSPLPALPDWTLPLNDLKQLVQQPRIPFKEQRKLVLNLREFLERKETAKTADALLKTLSKHSGRSVDSAQEITLILDELEHAEHASRGGLITGTRVAIVLIALFALATLGFIIVKGFPALNSQSTTAVTPTSAGTLAGNSTASATITPTTDLTSQPSQPTDMPNPTGSSAITPSPAP